MPRLSQPSSPPTLRRHYSAEFKARVLGQCQHGATSVAAVAREHGIHASLVYKWQQAAGVAVQAVGGAAAMAGFVALPLPLPTPVPELRAQPSNIEVELRRGEVVLKVRWPVGAAADCATWLRGVLA